MTPEEEKDIQWQGGQTATGTIRDAGKTLVRNNPLDETTPPPSERNDTAAAPATAQDGDAAQGRSERRKELERKTGVELATYGKDQGGEQGTTRGGDMQTAGTTDNTYMKTSRSTMRQVYDHTVPEARRLAFADADEMDRHLRDKGLTLGEIIMKHYPKPAYQEDEEKALKRRRTAALISDSFKLVSDIAAGAYGGNIYQRDNSKAYSDIDNKLQKLKDDYKRDYDKWLQAQLAARMKDRDTYLGDYRDFYDAYRRPHTVSESETNRTIYEDRKKAQEDALNLQREELEFRKQQHRDNMALAKAKGNGEAEDDYVDVHTPFGRNIRLSKKGRLYDQWVGRTIENLSETTQGRKDILRILYPYISNDDYKELNESAFSDISSDFAKNLTRAVSKDDLYRIVDALAGSNINAMKDLLTTSGYDFENDPLRLKREFNRHYGGVVYPEVLNYDATRVFELGDGIAVDENGNVLGRFDEYRNIVPLNETQMDFSVMRPAGENTGPEVINTGIDFSKLY